jgi:hypothetical protein
MNYDTDFTAWMIYLASAPGSPSDIDAAMCDFSRHEGPSEACVDAYREMVRTAFQLRAFGR